MATMYQLTEGEKVIEQGSLDNCWKSLLQFYGEKTVAEVMGFGVTIQSV